MSTGSYQPTIADFIWGPDHEISRSKQLSKFLSLCERETSILRRRGAQGSYPDAQIAAIIAVIKSQPSAAKSQITQTSSTRRDAEVVDFVVRLMFMTAVRIDHIALGGFQTFSWKDTETVADFLNRVYPNIQAGAIQDQPINTRNLTVYALRKRADIQIKPTDKLSDHLYLVYGDRFKSLLIFSHPSFLDYNLQILKASYGDLEISTKQALSCGSLPPLLLLETLRTLNLLFPQFGDKTSKKLLKEWVNREKLDERFLSGPGYSFETQQPPKDLQGLYEQYPYWGRHLARLLREVEDPTPITWWQRYTERGRSPRRMFECAVAALVVTAFSALVATVLAAVQVWIAYCDWDDAPTRSYCPSKTEVGAKSMGAPVI